ncbi:MAG: choice-of-anchor B family protein [Rhodothermales bacterium]
MIYRKTAFLALMILFSVTAVHAQKIQGIEAATGLGFGGSLAASDTDIFVGSAPVGWPRGDEPAGTVYRYTKSENGEWMEAERMQASNGDIGDFFGRSLYTDGSTLLVGAPGASSVYVFEKTADGMWKETGIVKPSGMKEGMEFGGAAARGGYRSKAIAMAGDHIVVTSFVKPQLGLRTAPRSENALSGTIHVFKKNGMNWEEVAKLTAEEPAQDGYGYAIAGEGDHIVVGVPGRNENKGAAYVYTLNASSGAWESAMVAPNAELAARSAFGSDVALMNGQLFVGAPRFEGSGAVFGFEVMEGKSEWSQVSQLELYEKKARSGGFGRQLAMADGVLIASNTAGMVYAYQKGMDGGWDAMHAIRPANDRSAPGFGIGLAAHKGMAIVGSPRADYEEGLATVYKSEAMGAWEMTTSLISEVAHLMSVKGEKVTCEEGSASHFACDKVDMISFMSRSEISPNRGAKMTDIWGWEDPETGVEYVLQGREDGVAFIDIGDPYNPVYVGQLMKTAASPGSGWRDVKVYKNHAYVVADGAGEHGVQIFDLTQLRDVNASEMPKDFDETARYDGVHSTHNIVINEETGYAYAVGNRAGGTVCGGQLHMINIQEPANPKFAGCYSHEGAGGTHDSQCVVYRGPDVNFQGKEVCLNSNGGSFIIADVSNKENPATISSTTYPNLAYTHQGWLTEDQKYFYMNDELDEMNGSVEQTRTLIWDVSELDDPVLVKEFMLDSKASDHNLYIKDNLMYQSNYQAGLRILDITDPENPVETAHFDTVPFGEDEAGFGGSWSNYPYFKSGIIAVSSRGEGMFLLKKQEVDL